jgi:AcrR family transcriptional regulator
MPRPADPSLPFRILAAAYGLWSDGGEEAVTIRDVARKAKTTTPSVYAQFEDRAAILRGVRKLARGRFETALARSTSFSDGCRRVLDFADDHPRDYELLFGYGYRDRAARREHDIEFAGFEAHIRSAGVPEPDLRTTALAVSSLLHGAAMFRLAHDSPGAWWRERRKATLDACAALIEVRRRRRTK